MMFKAKYMLVDAAIKGKAYYWRSIPADTINEAMAIAKRYVRKGYMLSGVATSRYSLNQWGFLKETT